MNNWFTNGTQSAGQGVSTFLSSFLNPVSSAVNNTLGTSTTTVTEGPKNSNSKTGTIVIAIVAVITLMVIGYVLLKKKAA